MYDDYNNYLVKSHEPFFQGRAKPFKQATSKNHHTALLHCMRLQSEKP